MKLREYIVRHIHEARDAGHTVFAGDPEDAARIWADDFDSERQELLWDDGGVVALVIDDFGDHTRVRVTASMMLSAERLDGVKP